MANLVQLSNDLEFVPKQQLIQMSQDPNTTYPSFLVLSEIQRRTQMEKRYAAQQPKPETTIAEELVAEFSGGQGLGAMAQPPSTLNAFQLGGTEDMAPPSPMQMMASGGKTSYQSGKSTTQEEVQIFNQLPEILKNNLKVAPDDNRFLIPENRKEAFTPTGGIAGDLITVSGYINNLKEQNEYKSLLKEQDKYKAPNPFLRGLSSVVRNIMDAPAMIAYPEGTGTNRRLRDERAMRARNLKTNFPGLTEEQKEKISAYEDYYSKTNPLDYLEADMSPIEKLQAIRNANKLNKMGMAGGGLTGYAEGQMTGSYGGYNIDAYPTQEELAEAKKIQDELIASGKITQEDKGFFEERYTMEDGSVDYATAALDGIDAITTAALVIPIAGWGIKGTATGLTLGARSLLGAYRAGRFKPLIEGGKRLAQKAYTRPNPLYKDAIPYGGKMINPKTGAEVSQRVFSPGRAIFSSLGLGPFLGQMGYAAFAGGDEADIDPLQVNTENENAKYKINNDLITGELNEEKGLFGRFKDFAKSSDNADLLIALGGAIGSARSPAELSSNISNAYFGLKNAADEKQYKGLQGKLIDAQIKNIETSIAGLPLKELQTSAQLIQDGLEAGTVDREKGIEMLETIFARIKMLQNLTETGLPSKDEDPLTKYKI